MKMIPVFILKWCRVTFDVPVKAMVGGGYGRLQVSGISPENGVSRMPGICTVK